MRWDHDRDLDAASCCDPALTLADRYSRSTASQETGITASQLTCPPDSSLTYANFGEVFIADNCLSCHTSRANPHLTTVESLRANRQAIINAAVTSTGMPRSATMTVDNRSLLDEWLTCGAPE